MKTALQAFQACGYALNQHGNSRVAKEHGAAWVGGHVVLVKGKTSEARRKHESAVKALVHGLALYIDAHQELFDSPVGDDGYCDEPVRDIAKAVITLLSAETGRLDCGTLDHYIREICEVGKVELDP